VNPLIVPINVEALCINNQSQEVFFGPTADFSGLTGDKPYLSESVVTMPGITLERGVHLHWALPEALTHGIRDEDQDKIVFPAVPNRWLVTRIHSSNAKPDSPVLSTSSWVIESDYLSESTESGKALVPFRSTTGNSYFRSLGHALPYESWHVGVNGDQSYFKQQTGHTLTAVGYGEVAFAAYYPNCRSVFGFHDDLSTLTDYDPQNNRISYVVSGWYSENEDDPLSSGKSPSDMNWGGLLTATPDRTLCSGTVKGIAWDSNTNYFPQQKASLEVAVGNNRMECVSALLAARPELAGDPHAEYLLNSVQMGLLESLSSQPGWTSKISSALHGETFASHPGGKLWNIRPHAAISGPSGSATSEDLATVGERMSITLPASIASELNALNKLQVELDRTQDEIDSLRKQLFHDWYRYTQLLYSKAPVLSREIPGFDDPDIYNKLINDMRHYIQDEVHTLMKQKHSTAAALSAQIKLASDNLSKALANIDPSLLLETTAAPRYWEAADPVILLAGDAVTRTMRYGGANKFHEEGKLPCRTMDQTMSELSLTRDGKTISIGSRILPAGTSFDRTPVDKAHLALVTEAVLSDPNHDYVLVAAFNQLAADAGWKQFDKDAIRYDLAALHKSLAGGELRCGELGYAGKLPCPMAATHHDGSPWIPLFLQWTIDYLPLQYMTASAQDGAFRSDLITGSYDMHADEPELIFTGTTPNTIQTYSGTVVLSSGATLKLQNQIARYLEHNPDPELTDIAKKLTESPMLAQALSGFNHALRMGKQSIQLDVYDPMADDFKMSFDTKVAAEVLALNDTAPLPLHAYNPIRAGAARLTGLRLIDAFGRLHAIDLDKVRISRTSSITPSDPKERIEGMLKLPPRISQPSRLLFRFLAADDDQLEMNDHPATTPVCGWILPDHLIKAFEVYAGNGDPLGALEIIGGGTDVRWRTAPIPGRQVETGDDKEVQADHVRKYVTNAHLQRFILAMLQGPGGAGYMDRMFQAVERSLGMIQTSGGNRDSELGVLMSRPIAVVRASLKFELQGLPSPHNGWPSLLNDIARGADGVRDTRGFTKVQFGVRLGEPEHPDDGLVGYFLERQGTTEDYLHFYSTSAELGDPDIVQPWTNPITLVSDASSQHSYVTMLMDPTGKVHASTGILPVKSLQIPQDQYRSALKAVQFTFGSGPLLISAAERSIPLPAIKGYSWSWLGVRNGEWTELELSPGATDRAAIGYSPGRIEEGRIRLSGKPLKSSDI
jgi:hypothetical protein